MVSAGMQAVRDEQDADVAQWAPGAQDPVQCVRGAGTARASTHPHRQRRQPQQGQARPASSPQQE